MQNKPTGHYPDLSSKSFERFVRKVCIQVDKVFDACLVQALHDSVPVTVTEFIPPAPPLPLTFISAFDDNRGYDNRARDNAARRPPGFSRVQVTVEFP